MTKTINQSRRLALVATAALSLPAWSAPPAVTAKPNGLANLTKKVDKIEETTWYRDKSTTEYNNRNSVHIYLGQKGPNLWMRLRFQYLSEDWLFIDKAIVVVDGKKLGTAVGRWERDHGSGNIWEWLDLPVGKAQMELIEAMAGAKEVVIRYEGRQYYKDRTVPAAQTKAIRNVLLAFKESGGKF